MCFLFLSYIFLLLVPFCIPIFTISRTQTQTPSALRSLLAWRLPIRSMALACNSWASTCLSKRPTHRSKTRFRRPTESARRLKAAFVLSGTSTDTLPDLGRLAPVRGHFAAGLSVSSSELTITFLALFRPTEKLQETLRSLQRVHAVPVGDTTHNSLRQLQWLHTSGFLR